MFRGIHEYDTIKELIIDDRNKFIINELHNSYNKNNLVLREYMKPKYGLSVQEFYEHCEMLQPIDIDNL